MCLGAPWCRAGAKTLHFRAEEQRCQIESPPSIHHLPAGTQPLRPCQKGPLLGTAVLSPVVSSLGRLQVPPGAREGFADRAAVIAVLTGGTSRSRSWPRSLLRPQDGL